MQNHAEGHGSDHDSHSRARPRTAGDDRTRGCFSGSTHFAPRGPAVDARLLPAFTVRHSFLISDLARTLKHLSKMTGFTLVLFPSEVKSAVADLLSRGTRTEPRGSAGT